MQQHFHTAVPFQSRPHLLNQSVRYTHVRNPEVPLRVHVNPAMISILRQINPVRPPAPSRFLFLTTILILFPTTKTEAPSQTWKSVAVTLLSHKAWMLYVANTCLRTDRPICKIALTLCKMLVGPKRRNCKENSQVLYFRS
jgi:hypothetical protein